MCKMTRQCHPETEPKDLSKMADLIITIDGPAASGKSTAARLLSRKMKASFLDTGAMYRAVTLEDIKESADLLVD